MIQFLNSEAAVKQQLLTNVKANHIRQVIEPSNFDACGKHAMQHKNSLLVACLGRLYNIPTVFAP